MSIATYGNVLLEIATNCHKSVAAVHVNLLSKEARRRLKPRAEPYYQKVARGIALGYYRGPKSARWTVRRMVGGKRIVTRIGAPDDKQQADGVAVLSYRHALEEALSQTGRQCADPGYTVTDAVEDYLDHYRVEGKAIADTESAFNAHIVPEFGRLAVNNLTVDRIKRWRNRLITEPVRRRRGKQNSTNVGSKPPLRSKATANRLLTVLKAALNYVYNESYVSCDPVWRKVKPFRMANKPRVRWLQPEEIKKLIDSAEADFRPMIQAAVLTGCRYGELAKLKVGDYYAGEHATIHVRESKGSSRYVPLTNECALLLDSLTDKRQGTANVFLRSDGEPWGDTHQHRRMRRASLTAEIDPPVTFHTLRHCYGSWLAQAGVPLQVISLAIGHSSVVITERFYAHLAPDYVAQQIRAHLPNVGITVDGKANNSRP